MNDFWDWKFDQASAWISAMAKGDISIAPDGTRVGHPAKENMVIPCHLHTQNLSVVLPPMVPFTM